MDTGDDNELLKRYKNPCHKTYPNANEHGMKADVPAILDMMQTADDARKAVMFKIEPTYLTNPKHEAVFKALRLIRPRVVFIYRKNTLDEYICRAKDSMDEYRSVYTDGTAANVTFQQRRHPKKGEEVTVLAKLPTDHKWLHGVLASQDGRYVNGSWVQLHQKDGKSLVGAIKVGSLFHQHICSKPHGVCQGALSGRAVGPGEGSCVRGFAVIRHRPIGGRLRA
jgi:hypothetical protein